MNLSNHLSNNSVNPAITLVSLLPHELWAEHLTKVPTWVETKAPSHRVGWLHVNAARFAGHTNEEAGTVSVI